MRRVAQRSLKSPSNPRYHGSVVVRLILSLLILASSLAAQARIPVIIDTDIGDSIDDSLALGLALSSPELDVRGVTTVIDDVESKTRLAAKQLVVFGRRDIPLAMGAPAPLLDPELPTHPLEFRILTPADKVPATAQIPAAVFLIQTLMNAPTPLTLVAIGPLTNIALALRTEPRIKAHIERIVLMAGAFSTPQVEYNVKRDPVAAQIVFQSGVPILAAGLEVTTPCKLRPDDLDRLRLAQSPAAHFLIRLIELSQKETGETLPTLYDPVALASVFRSDLIETAAGNVTVDVDAGPSRGQTHFRPAPGGTTRVGVKVNANAFLDLFIHRLASDSTFPPR
jgi:purine nucleosidase